MALTRLRIVIVTTMCVVLAIVAGTVFDAVQRPILVGPLLVGATAVAVQHHRWPARVGAALITVGVGVVLGVVFAGGTIGDAVPGVLRGPRRLITTEWPSPSDPTIIGTIALLVAVATAISADLAGRDHLHLTPLLPVVSALAALFGLGAPVRPPVWAMIALGVLAALVMLARPGESLGARRRSVLGERTLVVSALTVVAVAIGTSTAVAWSDRADPRRIEDAKVTATVIDSLESVVALRDLEPERELFAIVDRSTLIGRSLPSRWRIAALDGYDGQRWIPKLTLRPIGGRLGIPAAASPDRPPPIRYELEYLTDDFELVPFPGRPLEVSADVETDLDRVVVRLTSPPAVGTSIDVFSEVTPGASSTRAAMFATRQVDDISGGFTELATNLAGDGTIDARLRRIERAMREDWQLDPGAPGSGQQLALIDRFVNDTRRGTTEQFVTAFVLLARSLGFDARIASGFVLPPDELATSAVLSSRHAAIWPEVRLDGVGWLTYDPVPPRPATDDDEPPPPPESQSPAAAQPPIAPPAETGDDSDESLIDARRDSGGWGSIATWAGRIGAVAGIALGPFLLMIGVILTIKYLRRRRRLRAADPAHLIRGAWANATDSLVDAGLTISASWTDDRIARRASELAPTAPHEARRLAAMATAMTFGSARHGRRLVDDAVLTSSAIDTAIRADRTRWQRLRWRLSLRSLRRSTRSPVTT